MVEFPLSLHELGKIKQLWTGLRACTELIKIYQYQKKIKTTESRQWTLLVKFTADVNRLLRCSSKCLAALSAARSKLERHFFFFFGPKSPLIGVTCACKQNFVIER